MKCKYINKFKSWEPVARTNDNISKYSFILSLEK